jgi:hypothetical protein
MPCRVNLDAFWARCRRCTLSGALAHGATLPAWLRPAPCPRRRGGVQSGNVVCVLVLCSQYPCWLVSAARAALSTYAARSAHCVDARGVPTATSYMLSRARLIHDAVALSSIDGAALLDAPPPVPPRRPRQRHRCRSPPPTSSPRCLTRNARRSLCTCIRHVCVVSVVWHGVACTRVQSFAISVVL